MLYQLKTSNPARFQHSKSNTTFRGERVGCMMIFQLFNMSCSNNWTLIHNVNTQIRVFHIESGLSNPPSRTGPVFIVFVFFLNFEPKSFCAKCIHCTGVQCFLPGYNRYIFPSVAFVRLSVRTAPPVGKEVKHNNCTTDPT